MSVAPQAAARPVLPAAPRPKPAKIDWKGAARMLAEGIKPPAIAAALQGWTPPLFEEGKPPPSRASIYRTIIDLPGPDNPTDDPAG
ncbi:MAG TPA: hypothetical protein VF194_10450 [Ferrovibrio sp.]|uniref:hypothetical protein n=1 Tax=Ferrovibrio sp. TaxID=1917215 RepID=UPI002ED0FF0B